MNKQIILFLRVNVLYIVYVI